MAGLEPVSDRGLLDVVDRILDKGIVINADISVSVAGTELLGIKIRATLSSFETAARYGMELPSGTDLAAPGWKEVYVKKAKCPECENRVSEETLIAEGCPICGWTRNKNKKIEAR